ncbi:MAG TPA: hypothetical protein VMT08_30710 [Bradyrhizobium sp.]|nr:hypothetical protein [Bradyrhizobium sp.]
MGKRFVPVRNADQRAIELYKTLREVEQMPLIAVEIGDGSKPIILYDANNPNKWDTLSVDGFLSLDVGQAKAEGGTFMALKLSRKKPGKPRLPQAEVDRAVEAFMTGKDDE